MATFFRKSAVLQGKKGPGVQGKRWPKYRYRFSSLKVRGGPLPSKKYHCQTFLIEAKEVVFRINCLHDYEIKGRFQIGGFPDLVSCQKLQTPFVPRKLGVKVTLVKGHLRKSKGN